MPPVRYVDTNGVRMAIYEAGERRGPPVVFLHGFPELAFSWRHQLQALAAAGRWAIAPDQRGYGLTDAPDAVEAYDMEALTGDLVGLLDALQVDQAIWCGHDWGGLVGWQMPIRHPGRTAGVIGLNTPFLPRTPIEPVEMLRQLYGPWHYIVFFQARGAAEALFQLDVRRSFQFFMRTGDAQAAQAAAKREGTRSLFALQEAINWFSPKPEQQLLAADELDVYVEAFQRTGFRGGINWYRNLTRNWEEAADQVQHVPHPALMITAEHDPFLPPRLAAGMEAYVPNLDRHMVEGSGHWTQQEKPEEVSRVIVDWLDRRFPLDASGATQ
ncbi:MAG TPA: alpha/beta hydrolase [Caulobacteraceae bacterium]|jgi:pimeloyl-ACP methyl ester carboxylesterase